MKTIKIIGWTMLLVYIVPMLISPGGVLIVSTIGILVARKHNIF